ncbi:MAG: putative molybdenum carrier protein [Deltaproteobacteria bacterium]|nr:putative molybdenum carrier protein [Deltaproteobacteria bacterium]
MSCPSARDIPEEVKGRIEKIVSGGQTGADRAALDAAIRLGIPHGGWIPKGRRTEGGFLPARYHMREMPTADYAARTERNVLDSDGTLIVSHGSLDGGSALTEAFAEQHGRPHIHLDMDRLPVREAADALKRWISDNAIRVLNVAGPRESRDPDIYRVTAAVLETLFREE